MNHLRIPSPDADKEILADLRKLYGDRLDLLSVAMKRRLNQMAACAFNHGWPYTINKLPKIGIPFEAIALCQQLSPKGTLRLNVALSCALLTGDTLTVPSKEPTD
jgi:hypothetical protein